MLLNVNNILTKKEIEQLNTSIEKIKNEKNLQLVVHIEALLENDIEERTAYVFEKLQLRNIDKCVFLLISVAGRAYSCIIQNKHQDNSIPKNLLSEEFVKALEQERYYDALETIATELQTDNV